jgi:hypothetical protein
MTPYLRLTAVMLTMLFAVSITGAQTVTDTTEAENRKPSPVGAKARYPRDSIEWLNYIQTNLKPDVPVKNGAPIGRYTVVVQFIVDKEGYVSDVKALTNFGYGMEDEVLRIIKKSVGPAWTPAGQSKKPVKAYHKQSATFLVEDEAVMIKTEVPYTLFTNTNNEVSIRLYNAKPGNVSVTVSEGTVEKKGDETYIIKADKPGRILLRIVARKRKKQVAAVSFEVKEKP